jgi:hypothetical protein
MATKNNPPASYIFWSLSDQIIQILPEKRQTVSIPILAGMRSPGLPLWVADEGKAG